MQSLDDDLLSLNVLAGLPAASLCTAAAVDRRLHRLVVQEGNTIWRCAPGR